MVLLGTKWPVLLAALFRIQRICLLLLLGIWGGWVALSYSFVMLFTVNGVLGAETEGGRRREEKVLLVLEIPRHSYCL